MSKRQYKLQASSSRAVSATGFGGFGSTTAGSTISYLVEPPDLSAISDANVVVAFKNLSKKDGTTKAKALDDLRSYVQAHPFEQDAGTEEAVLGAWVKFYPRIAIDNSRRVRELAHNVLYELAKSVRKRFEKYIPKIVGSWLAGTFDRDRAVARVARDGITFLFDSEEKVAVLWKRCQPQILEYAQEAVKETPQTLSDERTMSTEDANAKYFRVIGGSLSLVINLLLKLGDGDIAEHQEKYEAILADSKKVWSFAASDDATVRRSTAQLLLICLDKQPESIKANLEVVSHAFISEALRSSQSSSALQLIQVLEGLTREHAEVWTTSYKGKKSPIVRLRSFIEKGSQGGPPEFWTALQALIAKIPEIVLPTESETGLQFLDSYRKGIINREESRNNALEAWWSYLQVVELLSRSAGGGPDFLKQSVHPILEQYLDPATANSRWAIANTDVVAKAYLMCANGAISGTQELEKEWARLRNEFETRIATSLPEQSKDYQKSQNSIALEGKRWFTLVAKVLQFKPSLLDDCKKIIGRAIKTVQARNGKPHGAAAVIEDALAICPELVAESSELQMLLKSFLEQDLPKLIICPSSIHLVSTLKLFGALPEQRPFFEQSWQSAVDSAISAPDEPEKLAAINALISDQAVSYQAQQHPALQDYLQIRIEALVKGESDTDVWSLFQAALSYSALSAASEQNLLRQILANLNDRSPDNAFRALELISQKTPHLIKNQSGIQVALITKLLAMSELSDSGVSSRAIALRSAIDKSNNIDGQDNHSAALTHVLKDNLETAHPQSLSISTLIKQAKQLLNSPQPTIGLVSLLPDTKTWRQSLSPLLSQAPSTALGVMRPFAGTVFLVRSVEAKPSERPMRDSNGCSVALRMAMYSAGLLVGHSHQLPPDMLVDVIILIGLTANIVSDQVDLNENNKLFASNRDLETVNMVRDFIESTLPALWEPILINAKSWRDMVTSCPGRDTSSLVQDLIPKLVEALKGKTPTAFYSARFLGQFLSRLVEAHGWPSTGDEWLSKLDILKTMTPNPLGAIAVLTGLADSLSSSKLVNNLCNRLVSDVTGASLDSEKLLQLLVLLNASLDVYIEDDLPIAQNRVVFAVQKLLSWTNELPSRDLQITAEVCRALQKLLPAIRSVYGSYWEDTIEFCIAVWDCKDENLDQRLPSIGASLKLLTVLRNMKQVDENLGDGNDDLKDAWDQHEKEINDGILRLLSLPRQKPTQPLDYVAQLLMRLVTKVPIKHLDDPSDFYPLIASDLPKVQSMAFDVLYRAMPAAQEQVTIDVMVAKKDAHLPEELLSLLLDAPSLDKYTDDELSDFPSPIRGYLLSWLLIYSAYHNAPYKIRNDYSEILKSSSYIPPLLSFLFDILGHSAGAPLNLEKHHFSPDRIRTYNLWEGINTETNERNMQWLLIHLYYLSLKFVPSLVKTWWMDCKSKQTRLAVSSWTEKYFSPLLIEDTLEEVQKWAEEQEPANDEKPLLVKASKRSREVFAGYEVDEMQIQIVIRLPEAYPLDGVKVEGVNRVAVSEKKWSSWLMITQGVITFSNGSLTDGLSSFHKNVTGALKGQTECAICYSIIGSDKKAPDKQCQVCKNLFHSGCLFKWFASSNQSTCPLCRNAFNYGVAAKRRGGGSGGGD